jgi:lipopolysaccharide exporter
MEQVQGLIARGVGATLWGGLGSTLRIGIQIGSQIVLARVLGPEQYGLFAMGVIVVSLAGFFSDIGIAYGLIQKAQLTEDDIRFVFSWQLVLGAIVASTVMLLSAWAAGFFGEPRTEEIIRALAAVCFVNALGAVSLNLLKRDLDFKRLHLIQAASYFVGFVGVGVPSAIAGAQVWALVFAYTVQALVSCASMYWCTRHRLALLYWHAGARQIGAYASKVFATNLLNWTIGNADRVFVSRMFPSAAVGLYSTSYNVVSAPTISLMGVLQSVLFSICALAQARPDRLQVAFLTMIGAVSLFIMPVFIGIAAVADTFVVALYGEAWRPAGEIIPPLACAMSLYLLLGMATPLLWTGGKTGTECIAQIPIALLWIVACAVAASHSLSVLAWTVFTLFLVRFIVIMMLAWRALGLTAAAVARVMAGGVTVCAIVTLSLALADHLIGRVIENAQINLAGNIFVAGLVFVTTLFVAKWVICPEVASLIREIATRLPAPLASVLDRLLGRAAVR